MKKCIIFSAAQIFDYSGINPDNSFVIAADGGLIHTKKLNITPDVVIGDMDSYDGKVPEDSLLFPVKKDDTDTMLAIKKGLELGFSDFEIYGGMGGRFDHTIANIQSLSFLKNHNANGVLKDENHTVYLIKNERLTLTETGKYISVFAYGADANGVSLSGFEYPLENGTLSADFPLGVSNKAVSKEVSIEVSDGVLLVIVRK